MDITVNVAPRPAGRVGALKLVNETPFSEPELRGQLQLKPKTEITSERLDRGTERVRKSNWMLIHRAPAACGYLGARVSVSRGSYDAQANQLPLDVHFFAGLNQRNVVGSPARRQFLPSLCANCFLSMRKAPWTKTCSRRDGATCAIISRARAILMPK